MVLLDEDPHTSRDQIFAQASAVHEENRVRIPLKTKKQYMNTSVMTGKASCSYHCHTNKPSDVELLLANGVHGNEKGWLMASITHKHPFSVNCTKVQQHLRVTKTHRTRLSKYLDFQTERLHPKRQPRM